MLRRLIFPAMFFGLIGAPAMAQDAAPPPPPPGDQAPAAASGTNRTADRADRGNRFDPAQFRQRMMDRIKDQMGASDDEWKVIEPKLDKVMQAERDARGGGMGMMFGRRSRDRGQNSGSTAQNNDRSQSAVEQASLDLRKTLDNKDASASEIASKLTALRDARTKAHANLQAAQKDLKDVLTARQEAVLVMMGMLD